MRLPVYLESAIFAGKSENYVHYSERQGGEAPLSGETERILFLFVKPVVDQFFNCSQRLMFVITVGADGQP